ncbi:MAG TPA: NADH-quinone oxidoreductase subunit NuoF [Vicinamibacteria bacterium]|nr:NADH-quinone oxidoreductase subunit NuoF [Vicinamibacteria bacterium]
MEFTPENKARFDRILARYPVKRSALLPALHLIQEQEGYITSAAIEYAASLLELTPAQVHDTASFYTMYRFRPEGRRHIEVCTNISCALSGADELIARLCDRLGIREGETSADGEWTVHRVECLAGCGGAVCLQVDGRWVENAKTDDIEKILSGDLRYRPFAWPKSPGETILLKNVFKEGSASIDVYRQGGGYSRLKEYLQWKPEAITDAVKKANLRGRGGAGFPAGMKWSFLAKNDKPRYLCINADEGEPGTYKDRLIMENDPHQLIEGCIVSSHAINCKTCYIYVRGEFHQAKATLEKAIEEAYAAGLLGKDILGLGMDLDIYVHSGAGSYECGEETALLESLEGKRGQPRVKPPFPAVSGLYNCPTAVNNVETICCVPLILERGAEWFASYGVEKNGGPKLYCISGHVKRPGVFETPSGGITMRDLVYGEDFAQGLREGRKLRCVIPGGSSTPVLTHDELDFRLDFDSILEVGSMLGSAGTIVIDDSACMVWVARKLAYFYKHESCGKCSPCREGTGWLLRLLDRVEEGRGTERDLEIIATVCDSIMGKTVCAFGDAAATPPLSTLSKFRDEYEYHVREKGCWRRVATTFEEARARAGAGQPAVASP